MQKYIDELLEWMATRKIKLNDIITHRLPIDDAPHGYEVFKNKKEVSALLGSQVTSAVGTKLPACSTRA